MVILLRLGNNLVECVTILVRKWLLKQFLKRLKSFC